MSRKKKAEKEEDFLGLSEAEICGFLWGSVDGQAKMIVLSRCNFVFFVFSMVKKQIFLRGVFPFWAVAWLLLGGVGEVKAAPDAKALSGSVAFVPQTEADRYQAVVEKLVKMVEDERYEEAQEVLNQSGIPEEKEAMLLNLRGAIYTGLGQWEAARKNFTKALEIAPNLFAARFNMGEVLFLEGNWEEALQYFEGLSRKDTENELLEYKLVLLFLLTGRQADAERLGERMRFPGNSPAWYYAQAALAFSQKRKAEGENYLYAVHEIFPEKGLRIYDQSIQESGLRK